MSPRTRPSPGNALALLAAICTAALAPTTALAQPKATEVEDTREHALEIIARHVEAIGGEKAILARKNITTEARLTAPAMGIDGAVVTHLKAPDLSLTTITMGGIGEIKQGYDGAVSWYINPLIGVGVMDEEQTAAYIRSSDIFGELHFEKYYPTIRYDGMDEIEGQPVLAVVLVDTSGREATQYYSPETGLRVAADTIEISPQGEFHLRTVFDAYKSFGDLKFATEVVQHIGPQSLNLVVEKVTYDVIPDETFDLPPAVKIVVEQQKQAAADDHDDADDGDVNDDDADDEDDDGDDEDD